MIRFKTVTASENLFSFSKTKKSCERPGNFAIFHDTENERPSRPALRSNYCSYPAIGICMTAMAAPNSVEGKQMQWRMRQPTDVETWARKLSGQLKEQVKSEARNR